MIFLNKHFKVLILFCVFANTLFADGLQVHYRFDSISSDGTQLIDATENKYRATLLNGAEIRAVGPYKVLDLGAANGYLDLGPSFGNVLASLSDFSISTYLLINEETNLGAAGNFVWAFGNSDDIARDANGACFFSAKSTRYAISTTQWQGEQAVGEGSSLTQGQWKHVVYTQVGNVGTLYLDAELVATGEITITPSHLGTPSYNYIGRSVYANDTYLKNTLLYDFRVYDKGLSQSEIDDCASELPALNVTVYYDQLVGLAEEIMIADSITTDLTLPEKSDGVSIVWSSSQNSVVASSGKVTRPLAGSESVQVTLTALFQKGTSSYTKNYPITILPYPEDEEAVAQDAAALELDSEISNLRSSLSLITQGDDGSIVSWSSSDEDYLSNQGVLKQLSPTGSGKTQVELTATVTKGNYSAQRVFSISIAEDDGFSAYLFSYFIGNSGDQEAIRFALSYDGYNYRALNANMPIVASSEISSTGGVRDPHILRGEDGNFYMVVTDMVSAYGWASNRAMVLLKSSDLVNWTSSVVNIQDKYDGQEELLRVWAPQTIYDEEAGKYMLYWSMQYTGGIDIIYYAYANSDFTDLEGEPKQLFYHPENKASIDGDIIEKEGKFYLFFKTEGSGNGIMKAVSDSLTGGYVLIDKTLQQTTQAVEGSSVFRMINSDTFILMYDMYSSGKYQFTESSDLENFSIIDNSISMNFHPRHGTVIPITSSEAELLSQEWGRTMDLQVYDVHGDHVVVNTIAIDNTTRKVSLTISEGDIAAYNPKLVTLPGATISPLGAVDFTNGAVNYTLSIAGVGSVNYSVDVNTTISALSSTVKKVDHLIYPNPVRGYLTVDAPYECFNNNKLCVFDVAGAQVVSAQVTARVTTIDVLQLKESPYYLVYTMDDKVLWSDTFLVK